MTEDMKTNGAEMTAVVKRDRVACLVRKVQRQIDRHVAIVNDGMETLAANFMTNFEWEVERVYKSRVMLAFYTDLKNMLAETNGDADKAGWYLAHIVEHTTDDIVMGDPYASGSNLLTVAAHRWEWETKKAMLNATKRLLDTLTED